MTHLLLWIALVVGTRAAAWARSRDAAQVDLSGPDDSLPIRT
jgi:hypothetical protein